MHVVPAGVHLSRQLRRERQPGLLVDRQRVHVGADADGLAGLRAFDHGDHAGLADAAAELDAQLPEEGGHRLRGLMLLERELGVLVQLAPQRHQLGGSTLDDFRDAGVDIHAA